MIFRFWVGAALGALLVTGCGRPDLKLVPVEGTVLLDGKPLAYKSLVFIPEQGTAGNGAAGYTNGQGKYALMAVVFGVTSDHDGCPPGRYRVVVLEPTIPITEADFGPSGRKKEGDEPAIAIGPVSGPPARGVPAIYTSAQTTPLVREVPESGGVVDLELASERKRG